MRIAQVAPLFESVPPQRYGGTERIVSYLTEELVRQGHAVTLFASAGSTTSARLVTSVDCVFRAEMRNRAWLAYDAIQMGKVAHLADTFDVIHFHTDYLHLPLARCLNKPHVTTVHGRLDLPELTPLFDYFNTCPMVSISDSQRTPQSRANWCATVYHGLPLNLYRFYPESGNYFVFVGRISPEKRVDRAIDIALACGLPLYIAAKIDKADAAYFEAEIRHRMDHPLIHFIGECDEKKKQDLLGHAKALLFPIDWPEPFGLVMIEALACGAPVIAYAHGSVAEIIRHGVTGFIVHDQQEAIQAAKMIDRIDRAACRAEFEQRFTATRMAENYQQVYQDLIALQSAGKSASS